MVMMTSAHMWQQIIHDTQMYTILSVKLLASLLLYTSKSIYFSDMTEQCRNYNPPAANVTNI